MMNLMKVKKKFSDNVHYKTNSCYFLSTTLLKNYRKKSKLSLNTVIPFLNKLDLQL